MGEFGIILPPELTATGGSLEARPNQTPGSPLLVPGEGKGEVPLTDSRPVARKFVRARQLRREQTDAELLLWRHLRARRLNGLGFRRQFPLGPFITDFCCKERHLVIELDGGQHNERTGAARDKFRTGLIEVRGHRILRFWDNEVLTNIDGVLQVIADAAERSELNSNLTSP